MGELERDEAEELAVGLLGNRNFSLMCAMQILKSIEREDRT